MMVQIGKIKVLAFSKYLLLWPNRVKISSYKKGFKMSLNQFGSFKGLDKTSCEAFAECFLDK